jgi:hypothetical protein
VGDVFRQSGFWCIFAIPIGISGFAFLTTSNWENPAQIGKVGMYEEVSFKHTGIRIESKRRVGINHQVHVKRRIGVSYNESFCEVK